LGGTETELSHASDHLRRLSRKFDTRKEYSERYRDTLSENRSSRSSPTDQPPACFGWKILAGLFN
jgi:hypothetical protein